jgi:hypothetical protein
VLRSSESAALRSGTRPAQAFIDGYHSGLWLTIGLLAAGVVLSYLTLRPRRRTADLGAADLGAADLGTAGLGTAGLGTAGLGAAELGLAELVLGESLPELSDVDAGRTNGPTMPRTQER